MTGDQSSGHRNTRRFLRTALDRVPLAYVLAAAAIALIPAYATVAAQADEGSAIFATKCAACHTIGKGKSVGPDLKGITTTEDPGWLARWIASPSALIKAGDPKATRLVKQYPMQMPDLGLSSGDVDAVLAYVAQQSGSARAHVKGPLAPVAAPPPGPPSSAHLLCGRTGWRSRLLPVTFLFGVPTHAVDLLSELRLGRLSNIAMLRSLDEEAWMRVGTANDNQVSVRALAFIMAGHVRHHMGVLRERYGLG